MNNQVSLHTPNSSMQLRQFQPIVRTDNLKKGSASQLEATSCTALIVQIFLIYSRSPFPGYASQYSFVYFVILSLILQSHLSSLEVEEVCILPVWLAGGRPVNALEPRQDGHLFADDIFKWIFLNKRYEFLDCDFSLKCVHDNKV